MTSKSYSHSELEALGSDGLRQQDISLWELDTPALCVNLDRLESNIDTMQATLTGNGLACRPHAKTHKTPIIARMQLDAGAIGICVAKVSEAEVMFAHDIEAILMTTSNVTPGKIDRAMRLRRSCAGFIQSTDSSNNARLLSAAAEAMGVEADIVVDIDPGSHRTGISPGQPALELAQLVERLPGLRLRGLLCYDGGSQHVKGFQKRRHQALERLAAATQTFDRFRQAGLCTDIFSGGGTGTYNIDHETRGLSDVQVGSYIFMDTQYLDIGSASDAGCFGDFQPSLSILTTVLNDQVAGRVTTDAGAKACTINRPWPRVKAETGMSYTAGSDEFGTLCYGEDASRTYRVGDKLELIVSHCDPVVNLYDRLYAVRNERLEAIWPIAARGMST